MIVISDTNIIYSCFYKPDGAIANSVYSSRLPFRRNREHLPKIMKNNNLTKKQATALLKEFIQNITFFKVDDIPQKYLDKAEEIAQFVDPDDYPFIAHHLEKRHKIWTCDFELIKGLKEMGYDICVTTKDLKAKCYKKSV